VFVWAPLHNKQKADNSDSEDGNEGRFSIVSDKYRDEDADTRARRYGTEVMKACPSLQLFIGLRTVRMNVAMERHGVKGIHPYMLNEDGRFSGVRVCEDEFWYIDPNNPCEFPLCGKKFEYENLPEECNHPTPWNAIPARALL
jgi:hypothetical protein